MNNILITNKHPSQLHATAQTQKIILPPEFQETVILGLVMLA